MNCNHQNHLPLSTSAFYMRGVEETSQAKGWFQRFLGLSLLFLGPFTVFLTFMVGSLDAALSVGLWIGIGLFMLGHILFMAGRRISEKELDRKTEAAKTTRICSQCGFEWPTTR